MAGFVIEAILPGDRFAGTLKLVDLAECEILRGYDFGSTRAAWARWPGGRQLRVVDADDRVLFIEGEPDRLPAANEPLEHWLDGRTGSFRGFALEHAQPEGPPRICTFVDPLGTRPIYLLQTGRRVLLADKLATIAANAADLECAWPELLEAAAVGSLYSAGSSIHGVDRLRAGEVVEFEGVSVIRRRRTPYPLADAARPDRGAPERLEQALRIAVNETWIEPEGRLLLSGGLDSRVILGLAEGRRKTMSNDWYPQETAIARRVAAACGAEFETIPFAPEDGRDRMEHGYLITGAMQQSRYTNHLGMARRWREAGIPAITHGYFHNSVYRGWLAERWQRYPENVSPLAVHLGAKAHYLDMFGCVSHATTEQVLGFLSADGREVLRRQLRALADSLEPVIVDGFDLTFEKRVLNEISRQVYFSGFLGWIEEIDVESPIFHGAVWRWYASTHPADRHRDHALPGLFQRIGRGLADIPDVNTGLPVRPLKEGPRELWRNQFWFPAARLLVQSARKLRPAKPAAGPAISGQDWAGAYRQPAVLEALCAGLGELKTNPLFDAGVLQSALSQYLEGDNRFFDALWAVATAGQWHRFVRMHGHGHGAVRRVEDLEKRRSAATIRGNDG